MYDVIEETRRVWSVDGREMVEETSPGKFDLKRFCSLDAEKLRQMHACLGHVLTDLAADSPLVQEPTF